MRSAILILVCTASATCLAGVTSGVASSQFTTATVERFDYSRYLSASTFNFGNGMTYANLAAQTDYISVGEDVLFGLGNAAAVSRGKGGSGSYFGTGSSPTTFQLAFALGIRQFGFYGAEAFVAADDSQKRDGSITLLFYDASDNLVSTIDQTTPWQTFAWEQFHGFTSSTPIHRVVFANVGHMVMDDVVFSSAVPSPTAVSLITLGCFLPRRRK